MLPFLFPMLSEHVRIELALEMGELVFQQQLALFQPLHSQLVWQRILGGARDGYATFLRLE